MRGSHHRRLRAAWLCNHSAMRLLLIPLLLAVAVVLMAIVLATPPKARGAIDAADRQQEQTI